MTTKIGSSNVDTATIVTPTATQTLTNKTIDASLNTLSNIPNTALVNKTISSVPLGGNLASLVTGTGLSGGPYNGASTATLVIDPTVVATLTGTQTLTNKTIDASSNALSNIPNSALLNKTISGVALGSNLAPLSGGTGLTGGPFNGSTAATLAIDGTVVTLAGTQTLTGKTIDATLNTLTNIPNTALANKTISGVALGSNLASLSAGTGLTGGPFNGSTAASLAIDNTVVTLTGTQSLTNKTINAATNTLSNIPNTALTNSTISGIPLGGNLSALSAGTGLTGGPFTGANAATLAIDGTVVTLAGTQTLTGKTIDATLNTLSNIPNTALLNKTISGVALGSNLATLSIGTGLSGGSYNGGSSVTLAIDGTVATLTGTQALTNKTIGPTAETATITAAAPSATTNFDLATQSIQQYTSDATTNFTLNVRGSSSVTLNSLMAVGASMSFVLIIKVGTTGYYPNVIQIDGVTVTPKWLNGTVPTATNSNSLSLYSFNIIKTAASTYTVLGTFAQFL